MQLDSGLFVLFLASTWAAWRLAPKATAPGILLTASLCFYAFSGLAHLVLLLLLSGFNYVLTQGLSNESESRKRAFLFWLGVVVDAAVLVFYKWASLYLNLHVIPASLQIVVPMSSAATVAFPLGLSFFTFQMISCLTDVYRRNFQWTNGPGSFFVFAFFFPQISAGPIPRAEGLVPQLCGPRRLALGDVEAGLALFAYGLFKKLVIANRLLPYVDNIFAGDSRASTIPVALGIAFNVLYLYADFSGYTDMARGTARLFGIKLAENFNQPFLAESITEFWRRWHMTLSSWLRDYVFMPLVIRLRDFDKLAVVFSLIFTFLICGVWHRLSLPFAVYGLMQGGALSIEFLTRPLRAAWKWEGLGRRWTGRFYVFSFFALSNVMFRVTNLSQAWRLYGKLVHVSAPSSMEELCAHIGPFLFLLILFALALWRLIDFLDREWRERRPVWLILACAIVILIFGKLQDAEFVYVAF